MNASRSVLTWPLRGRARYYVRSFSVQALPKKNAPQTPARLGRETACLTSHFRSVAWKNFEQVVFTVLLGEEK
jgi:hypothetical protein